MKLLILLIPILVYASSWQIQFLNELNSLAVFLGSVLPLCYLLFAETRSNKSQLTFLDLIERFKNNITGTNAQFYESCTQLNESLRDQSRAMEATSATGDEISLMIESNSDSISKASEFVSEIIHLAEISDRSSKKMEESINLNIETNQKLQERIDEVLESLKGMTCYFHQISEKTSMINDIVFKTKLLSFNASVEAARAGVHGRGFSVVAEEVGNLAKSSGESAKAVDETLQETSEKIEQIINRTNEARNEISQTLEKVSQQTIESLKEFKENFQKTRSATKSISEQFEQVSTASAEQSQGVSEMRTALYEINSSVQRSSLVVSQTLNLADMLNTYIKGFSKDLDDKKMQDNIKVELELDSIPWDQKYSIGISKMDDEHKVLLDRINDLILAMNTDDQVKIKDAFVELKRYTVFHFDEEEQFQQRIEYPAYESHKKVHTNLLAAMDRFGNDLEKRQLDKVKLSSFLKNWLFTHIMGVDMQYANYHHERPQAKKLRAA